MAEIRINLRGARLDPAERLQAQIEGVCERPHSGDPGAPIVPGFTRGEALRSGSNNGTYAETDDFKVYSNPAAAATALAAPAVSAPPAVQNPWPTPAQLPKKLSKDDIGAPHNFRHLQHGVNPTEAMFGGDLAGEFGKLGAGGAGAGDEPIYRDGPPPFLGDRGAVAGHIYESWPGPAPAARSPGQGSKWGDDSGAEPAQSREVHRELPGGTRAKPEGTAAGAAQFLQELMSASGARAEAGDSATMQSPEPIRPVSNYEFDTVAVSPSEVIYTANGGPPPQNDARAGSKGTKSGGDMLVNATGADQLYAQVRKPGASTGAGTPPTLSKSSRPSNGTNLPSFAHSASDQRRNESPQQPVNRATTAAIFPAAGVPPDSKAVMPPQSQAAPSMWFHQGLERAKIKQFAQQLLSSGETGHFFVRDGVKSEVGAFAMSAKFPDGTVKNFLIRPTKDGWYRIRSHDLAFPSIPELVLYYVEQLRPELGVQLRFPSVHAQPGAGHSAQDRKLELLAMKVADKLRDGPERREKLDILTDR